ncbi:uncharacterized protein LOC130719041 [Lotus japonicus]|uniref:uncharacterized protein LOC130719041 n=1 Tax=Lotus japonicus TaxID=34305 RepID=UPI002583DCA1|nr:uncharacterized protein LOC130719041 [Lotus japonicus]
MQVYAVYGFPEAQNKWRTWHMIRRVRPVDVVPWLCIGDFNDILSPLDKLGGDPPDLGRMQVANQACADCGLSRVDASGNPFTWVNNRTGVGRVEERLDYVLINRAWEELWPFTRVSHLIRHQSDHSPIVFHCGTRRMEIRRHRTRMFRFEELWLESGNECAEIVAEGWSRPHTSLLGKIDVVGQHLKSWGSEKYGDLPKKIADSKKHLQRLQGGVQTDSVITEAKQVERNLDDLLKQEEIFWGQRSRANWLKHGDRNTRFFHTKATQRRKRNLIEEIKDDQGRSFEKNVDIARVLQKYFEDIFTSSNPSGVDEVATLVGGRVTEAHRRILSTPFTRDEVEEALFQMHPIKAPGLDGFPALFYQKFWNIVGDDVTDFCLQVLRGEASPEAQSAFVPGRLITDNALLAFECFHYMKKRVTGRQGMMALKLDMSKAYDRVEWPFLKSILTHMGFPLQWVELIMTCVTTVNFSIMVNGNPQPTIAPHRGLRQGDPLSPYLFILCGEAFSALIQRAMSESALHGIKIARSAPVISHLLFADDSVLFSRASLEEAQCIKNILATYERASGQVINLDKSMLSVSRNVPENCYYELQQLLGVKAVESYDKYLGLPTIIGKSKNQIFRFVKERVWKKLKGWKERTLSRVGREVLIKAVAQAIPSYVMSCFILPNGLCNEIEGMISRFYWGGDVTRRGMHWVKWSTLCQPKLNGGLGFRDFKSFNLALVAKNWWRIHNHPDSLLSRVFKAIYFPRGNMIGARKGYRPSYAWTSIWKTSDLVQRGTSWRIGNGLNVRIWEDRWLPHGSPINFRHDVVEELKLETVAHLIQPGASVWNKELIEWTFCPATAKNILAVPLPLHPAEDLLFWEHTSDGLYTVSFGYDFLQSSASQASPSSSSSSSAGLDVGLWRKFWKSSSIPRVKEVVWRICVDAIPTRASLRRRSLDVDPSCPVCGQEEESASHLFLQCPLARGCWFVHLGVHVEAGMEIMDFMRAVLRERDSWVISQVQTVLYCLWEARNRWLFEERRADCQTVLDRVAALGVPAAIARVDARQERTGIGTWTRPAADIVKVNVDASLGDDMFVGLGLVARDEQGEILAAASSYPTVAASSTEAEALCLRWAMLLSSELGFRRVQIETDSLQLFHAWNRGVGRSLLFSVVQDCKGLLNLFDYVALSFIRRQGNTCADFMARNASTLSDVVWIEEGPPGLYGLLQADILASMPAMI